MNCLSNPAKDILIKQQAAEIAALKLQLSKYKILSINQGDEIAETQARLSGTRSRVDYTEY